MPRSAHELIACELLKLPHPLRVAATDEFLAAVMQLLALQGSYVERLASRRVRPHEVEDVAREVILKAAEKLRRQFLNAGANHNNDWDAETDEFADWFKSFCGWPFAKYRSGEITNVIKRVWDAFRHPSFDTSAEVKNEEYTLDNEEYTLNPERELIDLEELQAEKLNLSRLLPQLNELDRLYPLRAFLLRLCYGIHTLEKINADTLVDLAKKLRLTKAQTALIASAASSVEFKMGQRKLTNEVLGRLSGMTESGVRYQVVKAEMTLRKLMGRAQLGQAKKLGMVGIKRAA